MAIVREYVRDDPHYHKHHSNSNLVWAIVLIIFLSLLFTYGLPLFRSATRGGTTQINIPDRFDININNHPAAPQGGGPPQPIQQAPAQPAPPIPQNPY